MKRKAFKSKNWESNVQDVVIEPCPTREDPLGYRAVFVQGTADMPHDKAPKFAIGASHLDQRAQNLQKAGYLAPMTKRAITMLGALVQQGQRASI